MTTRVMVSDKAPREGEMIYGCTCSIACGRVGRVVRYVTENGWNHWLVEEDWKNSTKRVRREPNDLLYEVTIQTDYSGM